MATLYEIWRLALPPTTILRAGEAGGTGVRAVVLARPTQPAFPDLHSGEVVLLSPYILDVLGMSLSRLIERLHGSSVLALGLSGPVDDPAIAAAQRTHMTLFELPVNADLRLVQRESDRLMADPEAQYERRAAQLYSALTLGGLNEGQRAAIVALMEQWTGHRVEFPAEPGMPTSVPVLLDGLRVGMVGSMGAHPWDRLALEQGAAALTILLDKERAIEATEDRLRANVIETLLAGVPLDVAAQRRAVEQGLSLETPHLLAALRSHEEQGRERTLAAIRRTADRLQQHVVVTEYEGVIAAIFPLDTLDDTEQRLRDMHAYLAESGFRLAGGFGVANDVAEWPNAWSEALGALRLGAEMLGHGVIAGGTELGVYRLLLSMADSAQSRAFYERTVGPLAAHDARQDGDLLHTLQMFFAYLGNHSQAALALHVHRNTLLYRLGRIAAITAHHLDRAPDRLALQLGMMLHRIYQSQKSEGKK